MRKITLALTLFIIILSGCNAKTDRDVKLSKGELKIEKENQKCLNNYGTSMEVDSAFILKNGYDSSDYILPESHSKLITINQLDRLEKSQLDYARNEIYARHGYIFKSKNYIDYFMGKSWYKINKDFSENNFNDIEKENLKIINNYVDSLKRLVTEVSNNYIDYDLDSDKRKEKVKLMFMNNKTKFKLIVNDSTLIQDGINFKNTMFIYDIDENDKYTEIAVLDEVAKETYKTNFYRYDKGSILYMGSVSGDQEDIKVTGQGKIITKETSKILTDFEYIVFYYLKGNQIKKYDVETFCEINVKIMLKEKITVLSTKKENSVSFEIDQGEKIDLLKSDELEWVFLQSSNGREGWIKLTKPNILNGKNILDVFQVY